MDAERRPNKDTISTVHFVSWLSGAGVSLTFDPELAAWVAGIAGVIVTSFVEIRRTGVSRSDLIALQIEVAEMRGMLNVLAGRTDDDESIELELDSE